MSRTLKLQAGSKKLSPLSVVRWSLAAFPSTTSRLLVHQAAGEIVDEGVEAAVGDRY